MQFSVGKNSKYRFHYTPFSVFVKRNRKKRKFREKIQPSVDKTENFIVV